MIIGKRRATNEWEFIAEDDDTPARVAPEGIWGQIIVISDPIGDTNGVSRTVAEYQSKVVWERQRREP